MFVYLHLNEDVNVFIKTEKEANVDCVLETIFSAHYKNKCISHFLYIFKLYIYLTVNLSELQKIYKQTKW